MRIGLLIGSLATAVLCAAPGCAAESVRIAYLHPDNPAHQPIYHVLREKRVLETLQDLLRAFRLPKTLLLQATGCKGVSNAWYENGAVTVCYEFVADVLARAPQATTPEGVTREDAIVGLIAAVALHEIGHALFDLLDVPIFGREEDAADQFAAYTILQLRREDARRLVDGAVLMFRDQASMQKVDLESFSNVHGLPAQRFFNLMCMAYGSDPKFFADFVERGMLPQRRAQSCQDEYAQASYAVDALIARHPGASRAKFHSALKRFRLPSR